jgi:hypothetical protein
MMALLIFEAFLALAVHSIIFLPPPTKTFEVSQANPFRFVGFSNIWATAPGDPLPPRQKLSSFWLRLSFFYYSSPLFHSLF